MQGVLSHSVYWVAFCGAIHGSLFFKSRWGLRSMRHGEPRRRLLCRAHKHSRAKHTLLGKPPINKDREGNRTPYFAGIPLDTCTKTTF